MPRAKQRTPELRARVLQVALAMLSREGVAGFTTRAVAEQAQTSLPAVYELFGDKAGLVREMFFAGFQQLGRRYEQLADTADERANLLRIAQVFRDFVRDEPVLAQVMFSRPFADFDPGKDELRAGAAVQRYVIDHVQRAIAAGILQGDATDVAHVLLAAIRGLAAQESAGLLGTTKKAVNRRWELAVNALIDGLASPR